VWGWGVAVCELGWRGFVADVGVEVGEIGGVWLGLGVWEYVG
jgi:hypothetical protein